MLIQNIEPIEQLNLVICDDDAPIHQELADLLEAFANSQDITISTFHYYDWHTLQSALKDLPKIHLFILDVELPDIDGISIGQILRAQYGDDIELIYTSYEKDYFYRSVQNKPIGLLAKPIQEIDLFFSLKKYLNDHQNKTRLFRFEENGIQKHLPLTAISGFEVRDKTITLYTENEQHQFRGTLSAIYEEIQPFDFLLPNQSYLVNAAKITKITHKDVIVEGISVPISLSRNRRKLFKADYEAFLIQKAKKEIR